MNNELLRELKDLSGQGYGGIFLTERYTQKIDALISSMFNAYSAEGKLVLIATGGYGRSELAPYSDIDIMFLAGDRRNTEMAEQLLHRLWDTGLQISHSFRTPDECVEEALRDIRTRTSLLEARYLAGDHALFDIFREKVYAEIAYKRKKSFVSEKLREMEKRHSDMGDSVFMLEPNVKEGDGGLRDAHTAYWISKIALKTPRITDFSGLLDPYDYKRFISAYDFLLRTRVSLHLEAGRKNDILSFDHHRSIALHLGFRNSMKFTAAERFMRYYYLKSKIIRDTSRKIMGICSNVFFPVVKPHYFRKITDDFSLSGGRVIATKPELFKNNQDKIMEGYNICSRTGKKFSETTQENIKSNLLRITRKVRNSPKSIHHFLEILRGPKVYETLREMHETGVLGRFIPEFGALRLLVVHEPYHLYTVDEHTLQAIRNLENIRGSKYKQHEEFRHIIIELKHFDTLMLSLLFHDIGKAAGRHHEREGYKRLKNIIERFNLDSERRARIEFLVRNHILMSKTALKREVSDMEVVAGFAEAVGDTENLKSIYLITYADMSAVNPRFLSSWKSYLLRELYERTKDYLSGIKEDRDEYLKSLEKLSPTTDMNRLGEFLDEMPARYMVSTTKPKIIEDYTLAEKMKASGFAMRTDTWREGVAEITVSAYDSPGLFSRIVGFLSMKGLNIVNGRIFTGKNGLVIDKISVSNWTDIWWEGLEADLLEGLRGVVIEGRRITISKRAKRAESIFDSFIEIDNEASDEHSLIEILTADRLGLLYDIARVFHQKDIDIVSAIITTEDGLAQDIFYVQSGGKKIHNTVVQELLADVWKTLKE